MSAPNTTVTPADIRAVKAHADYARGLEMAYASAAPTDYGRGQIAAACGAGDDLPPLSAIPEAAKAAYEEFEHHQRFHAEPLSLAGQVAARALTGADCRCPQWCDGSGASEPRPTRPTRAYPSLDARVPTPPVDCPVCGASSECCQHSHAALESNGCACGQS